MTGPEATSARTASAAEQINNHTWSSTRLRDMADIPVARQRIVLVFITPCYICRRSRRLGRSDTRSQSLSYVRLRSRPAKPMSSSVVRLWAAPAIRRPRSIHQSKVPSSRSISISSSLFRPTQSSCRASGVKRSEGVVWKSSGISFSSGCPAELRFQYAVRVWRFASTGLAWPSQICRGLCSTTTSTPYLYEGASHM